MTMDERVAKIIAIATSMPASSAAPLISAGIREAVEAERERVLRIAAGLASTPAYEQFERALRSGANSAWGA